MLTDLRPFDLSLNELCSLALDIATRHGFTEASPAEDIALMHSELSEALEEIRASRKMTELYWEETNKEKPCGIPIELADVIIRILHFCGKHKIDIGYAVKIKMEYNNSRPYKHGGKAL